MTLPIIIYILAGIVLLLIIAIIASILSDKQKASTTYAELNTSDSSIDSAKEKSNSIIHRALKQAHDMLVRAELASIKEVARSKHDTEKLEEIFQQHLDTLSQRSADHLEKTSRSIEQHYIELFKNTEDSVQEQIKNSQMRIVNQLDMITSEAEKVIKTEAEAAREELNQRMDSEFQQMKKRIAAYEKKRMEIVDEQIVDLVSETVKQTLGKSLSAQDQTDLIFQALNQAKSDGFFGNQSSNPKQ